MKCKLKNFNELFYQEKVDFNQYPDNELAVSLSTIHPTMILAIHCYFCIDIFPFINSKGFAFSYNLNTVHFVNVLFQTNLLRTDNIVTQLYHQIHHISTHGKKHKKKRDDDRRDFWQTIITLLVSLLYIQILLINLLILFICIFF